uniref:hypothetical protein n=1 Tax=Paraburkholderia terrae TaxID=311230 RepID=UPI00296B2D81
MAMSPDWMVWFGSFGVETLLQLLVWFGLVWFGLALRWHPRFAFVLRALPLYVCLFAGIRVMTYPFKRRPCAGRHLLFFAAAKKSRQKKAANTANPCSCLRAPNRSLTS